MGTPITRKCSNKCVVVKLSGIGDRVGDSVDADDGSVEGVSPPSLLIWGLGTVLFVVLDSWL